MEFKNHSQLEELKLSEEEAWEKRLGRVGKKGIHIPLGYETPIGHLYSNILETAKKEGLKVNISPNFFLKMVKENMLASGNVYESKKFNLSSTAFFDYSFVPCVEYAKKIGLSKEGITEVLKESYGPNNQHLNPLFI